MLDDFTSLIRDFYAGIGVTLDSLELVEEDAQKNIYRLILRTPDSHIVIGQRGKNLDATAHIFSRMLERLSGGRARLHMEVNDYTLSRDERLYRLIEKKLALALETQRDVFVERLSSYERKKAHDYISEKWLTEISTFSVGEGHDRKLCISYSRWLESLSEDGVGI